MSGTDVWYLQQAAKFFVLLLLYGVAAQVGVKTEKVYYIPDENEYGY